MKEIIIEEINLPKVVSNLDTLIKEYKAIAVRYETAIYDDSSIAIAKSERAFLNNKVKELDELRKRVKNEYLRPYDVFEAEIKSLQGIITPAIANIDMQVKAFESAEKEAKLIEIKSYLESVIGGLKEFVKLEKIMDEKWLNKTVKLDSVKADIDLILMGINNDLETLADIGQENLPQLKAIYFRNLKLADAISENSKMLREIAKIKESSVTAAANVAPLKPIKLFANGNMSVPEPQKEWHCIDLLCSKKEINEIINQLDCKGIRWKKVDF